MPVGQSKAMWQCKLYNLVDNLRFNASDVTWLPRNQNMHMWMKYKTDFKKYWTSEVDKYKSISVEIKRSERADFVDCVLILVSSLRGWRCSCTPLTPSQVHDHNHHRSPKWPHSSPGWDSERKHCVLTKEDMSWTFTILAIMVLDVNFNNPYKHLSSIVPPKMRILGPQKGDLLAPRIRSCVTNPSTSDCLLTLSDTCMLYIFRKLSSASTSLTKN